MGGDEAARVRLGNPATLGELYAMMRDAHEAMSPAERVADEAQTIRELDAITKGRGVA